ncbi:MAG: type II toxin-antitoxin system VapC family toxin [Cytophagaceae bacterium]|nr:MAG: type II toxin-antitoxin system VapC family toxin [Cytophagaceae bacterium]
MGFLLDTHAFIWFYNGDEKLPSSVRERISDLSSNCYVSIASLWEIGIKASIGKLALRIELTQLTDFMSANQIQLLPIEIEHIEYLQSLPFHHRDPFDRLLIAQALTEKLTLLTRDAFFAAYEVPVVW